MTIRPAVFEDIDGILQIYKPIVENTHISFEYETPDEQEMWKRVSAIMESRPWIVAEEDREIVGYSYATQVRGRTAYSWSSELSVYVRDDWHGRGVGKLLYLTLIDILKLQGTRNLYGVISLPNAGSEIFHKKLGFKKLADFEQIGYKNGEWRGIAWYYKRIGGSEPPTDFIPFGNLMDTEQLREVLQR